MKHLTMACFLFAMGCSSPQNSNKPSDSSPVISASDTLISAFLDSSCQSNWVEFTHLYPTLHAVTNSADETSILVDSLNARGYTLTDKARGNWTKGPRIVSYSLNGHDCDCQVDKLYYAIQNKEKTYKVTERVRCTEKRKTIQGFIPEDYEILDSISGTINDDSWVDYILILKRIDEVATEEKRIILVLLQQDSNYLLNAKNEDFMLSWDGGGVHGDPYQGLELDGQELTIYHFGGSSWKWSQEMKFTFDNELNQFVPHLYIHRSFWSFEPDSTMKTDSVVYPHQDTTLRHFKNPFHQ